METNLSSWSFFSYFINVYLNLSAFRYSRLALFLVVFPPDVPNAFPVRTGWYAAREHQSRRARGMLSVPENDPTGFVRVKRRDQRRAQTERNGLKLHRRRDHSGFEAH
jgi:hypothetical protein